MSKKLKPCPFCGGKPEIERPGTRRASMIIVCQQCGCRVESGDIAGLTIEENWAWNARPDIRRKTIEECAKLCEEQVQRPAGYHGSWEGYGPSMGDKTGTECAIAIRALAEAKP